jgi:hypothetical protein
MNSGRSAPGIGYFEEHASRVPFRWTNVSILVRWFLGADSMFPGTCVDATSTNSEAGGRRSYRGSEPAPALMRGAAPRRGTHRSGIKEAPPVVFGQFLNYSLGRARAGLREGLRRSGCRLSEPIRRKPARCHSGRDDTGDGHTRYDQKGRRGDDALKESWFIYHCRAPIPTRSVVTFNQVYCHRSPGSFACLQGTGWLVPA